jgi:acetolactate synthase-1/2/3 large subunit
MKTSDYIVKFLEKRGIKNVYILSGGAIMYLVDSLRKSNINVIPFLHEQGAGIACEADSIYNNSVSVLITTAGPGILNAINPITSAYIDGNPLLIISGQCKTNDIKNKNQGLRQKGVQEVDVCEILKSITKYSRSLRDYDNIDYELKKAFSIANKGRKGPVFLEIPLNIQSLEFDENKSPCFYRVDNENVYKTHTELDKIDKLIELLNNSKKPVILAGNGIRQSGALLQFKDLINYLRIPILLTWKSIDFISENHSLNFGKPGAISSRYANNILQECDLLISIGARLDFPTTAYDHSNFAKNAKKVIVDIDYAEIDKLEFKKDIIFNWDAKLFIEELSGYVCKDLPYIDGIQPEWLDYCTKLKKDYPICLPDYYNKKENFRINPYVFIEELSKHSNPDDVIVVSSSGSASEIMCQAFEIKKGQRFICSNGLGSMGYAIPAAIGACFASGKKRVVCVEGDGSFQMNSQELELIRRYNLPIMIFVLNNGGYKSIRDTHNKFFKEKFISDSECGMTLPCLERIVKSYDMEYFCIEYSSHLYMIESLVSTSKLPIIVEVMIDSDFDTQPKVQSSMDLKGNLVSGKLENMWPFLEE